MCSGKRLRPGQSRARATASTCIATTLHGRHGVRHFRGYLLAPKIPIFSFISHFPFMNAGRGMRAAPGHFHSLSAGRQPFRVRERQSPSFRTSRWPDGCCPAPTAHTPVPAPGKAQSRCRSRAPAPAAAHTNSRPMHRHNPHRAPAPAAEGFPVLYFFKYSHLVYICMSLQKLRRAEGLMRGTPASRIYPGCLTHIFISDSTIMLCSPLLLSARHRPAGRLPAEGKCPPLRHHTTNTQKQGHLIVRCPVQSLKPFAQVQVGPQARRKLAALFIHCQHRAGRRVVRQ